MAYIPCEFAMLIFNGNARIHIEAHSFFDEFVLISVLYAYSFFPMILFALYSPLFHVLPLQMLFGTRISNFRSESQIRTTIELSASTSTRHWALHIDSKLFPPSEWQSEMESSSTNSVSVWAIQRATAFCWAVITFQMLGLYILKI